MSARRRLSLLLLILIALALLYPGLTQPVMTLSGSIENADVAQLGIDMMVGEDADDQSRQMLMLLSSMLGLDSLEGQMQVYETTRSIWGTVTVLADTGNLAVALLIVLFSVVIPVFKLALQGLVLVLPRAQWQAALLALNGALSRWSMADVFVMGMLVAYMAGSASGQTGDILLTDATLGAGFWYFLAYCLFSIAAGSLAREAWR